MAPITMFGALTLVELSGVLGIFAGMLAAFYALVKYLLKNANDTQKEDRIERQDILRNLTEAMNKVADATNKSAEATEKSAQEAKERNGHLAEISNQNRDIIIQAVSNIKEQHVDKQTVNKEIVRNKSK